MAQYVSVDLTPLTLEEQQIIRDQMLTGKPDGVSVEEFLFGFEGWDGDENNPNLPAWFIADLEQARVRMDTPEFRTRLQADTESFLAMVREHTRI